MVWAMMKAAGRPAGQRHGQVDDVPAEPRLLHDGAEQDEHEDERRGDGEGRPEYPLGPQVDVVDDAVEVVPAVLEQGRGIAPEVAVGEEQITAFVSVRIFFFNLLEIRDS